MPRPPRQRSDTRTTSRTEPPRLAAYVDGAGLQDDPKGPLSRTIGRGTGQLTPLPQSNAWAMIERRRTAAGIETKVGNHSFRATGITAYL
jgi:hypothetical protein